MDLVYGARIQRMQGTRTGLGSAGQVMITLPGVYPCDVAPMRDELVMSQAGQQDILTHIVHFQSGTDIRDRDTIIIVSSLTNFSQLGDTYLIVEVLKPSETLSYIRCRAIKGKGPGK